MNKRQMEVIMGIIYESLEKYMSYEMTEEVAEEIREGIEKNRVLIDQLGACPEKRPERKSEIAGRHEERGRYNKAKRPQRKYTVTGKHETKGGYVEPMELLRMICGMTAERPGVIIEKVCKCGELK